MTRLRVFVLIMEWKSAWVGPSAAPNHRQHKPLRQIVMPIIDPNDLRHFVFHPELGRY